MFANTHTDTGAIKYKAIMVGERKASLQSALNNFKHCVNNIPSGFIDLMPLFVFICHPSPSLMIMIIAWIQGEQLQSKLKISFPLFPNRTLFFEALTAMCLSICAVEFRWLKMLAKPMMW